MAISPPSGGCAPARIFIRVLLPAPFSPTSAWTSPGHIVRSTPLSARTPGKLFVTPRTVRIGCPGRLLGPALVLVDIVASDQLGRDKDDVFARLFPGHDLCAHFDRLLRHGVRILGGGGLE